MTTTQVPSPAVFDDGGTIVCDLPCRKCGYNLRGLNQAGRCPECGTPVGLSCHGDLLRYADPAWLEKLGRGVRLILWGILVSLLAGIGGVFIERATGAVGVGTAIGFLGALVGFCGSWLVTTPDPSGIGEDKYVTDRKLVRLSLLLALASSPITMVNQVVHLPPLNRVLLVVASILSLASIVGQFAQLTYFQKLALRIPNVKLADRARTLRWALAISLGGVVILGGLAAFAAFTSAPAAPGIPPGGSTVGVSLNPGTLVFGCGAGLAFLAWAIVGILVLILISRLGREFRDQAQLAQATWAIAHQ